MIPRRRVLQMLPLAGAATLAGCSSAPPPTYYRLSPLPGASLQSAPGTVRVREIGIPAYLNQNGIAEPSGAYEFAVSANDLWAEPLADMLQSVLVQDLAQRLPQASITASTGVVGTPAAFLTEVNVLRFDPDANGQVTLQAQVALKAADDRFIATRTLQSSAMPGGADMASTMAAMSTLWAGLVDELAQMIAQAAR